MKDWTSNSIVPDEIWAVSSGSMLFAKAYYYRLWQWKSQCLTCWVKFQHRTLLWNNFFSILFQKTDFVFHANCLLRANRLLKETIDLHETPESIFWKNKKKISLINVSSCGLAQRVVKVNRSSGCSLSATDINLCPYKYCPGNWYPGQELILWLWSKHLWNLQWKFWSI